MAIMWRHLLRKVPAAGLTILLTAGLASPGLSGETHLWTDNAGTVHLGDAPAGHAAAGTTRKYRPDEIQGLYLDFMATYDQRWKTAGPGERQQLNEERQRLARQAGAAMKRATDGTLHRSVNKGTAIIDAKHHMDDLALRKYTGGLRPATDYLQSNAEAEQARRDYQVALERASPEERAQALQEIAKEAYR